MQITIRPLRYAGSWYEADPVSLERQINSFFAGIKLDPKKIDLPNKVHALVVPHAGYAYSGAAAAAAYKVVMGKRVKRIFLLGPSHHVGFFGVGVPKAHFFETPFGSLSVDQELMKALEREALFSEQKEAHAIEHSLEMQLPFIKKIFPKTSIVPLLIGHLQGEEEVHAVAIALNKYLQEDDLIVISSDFTHYGPRFHYMPCPEKMKQKIKELDARAYDYLQRLDLSGLLNFYQETGVTICGLYPMAILLGLLPKETRVSLLAYYTSQDLVAHDPEHSVSYMAIAFSKNDFRK